MKKKKTLIYSRLITPPYSNYKMHLRETKYIRTPHSLMVKFNKLVRSVSSNLGKVYVCERMTASLGEIINSSGFGNIRKQRTRQLIWCIAHYCFHVYVKQHKSPAIVKCSTRLVRIALIQQSAITAMNIAFSCVMTRNIPYLHTQNAAFETKFKKYVEAKHVSIAQCNNYKLLRAPIRSGAEYTFLFTQGKGRPEVETILCAENEHLYSNDGTIANNVMQYANVDSVVPTGFLDTGSLGSPASEPIDNATCDTFITSVLTDYVPREGSRRTYWVLNSVWAAMCLMYMASNSPPDSYRHGTGMNKIILTDPFLVPGTEQAANILLLRGLNEILRAGNCSVLPTRLLRCGVLANLQEESAEHLGVAKWWTDTLDDAGLEVDSDIYVPSRSIHNLTVGSGTAKILHKFRSLNASDTDTLSQWNFSMILGNTDMVDSEKVCTKMRDIGMESRIIMGERQNPLNADFCYEKQKNPIHDVMLTPDKELLNGLLLQAMGCCDAAS